MANAVISERSRWSRRERQRIETRQDLASAAFLLTREHGLANVRVPDIAAAAGVSPRTFNNYFASKEQAVVWPAAQHAAEMAVILRGRPDDEPLVEALIASVTGVYRAPEEHGLPSSWLDGFRALVMREPALHAEYLRASDAAEDDFAAAIALRLPKGVEPLRAAVVAASVMGAERAAVRSWMRAKRAGELTRTVTRAVRAALRGVDDLS